MTNTLLMENDDKILNEASGRLLAKTDFAAYDTIIVGLLSDIATYQTTYTASNGGKYFQGLETHSATPLDDTAADLLDTRPPTKPTEPTWTDTGIINQNLPFSIQIHEYVAPTGNGYQVIFTADDGVDVWTKSQGYGVEALERTWDWRKEV